MNAKACKRIRAAFRAQVTSIAAKHTFLAGGIRKGPTPQQVVAYRGTCDAGEGRRQYKQAKKLFKAVRL